MPSHAYEVRVRQPRQPHLGAWSSVSSHIVWDTAGSVVARGHVAWFRREGRGVRLTSHRRSWSQPTNFYHLSLSRSGKRMCERIGISRGPSGNYFNFYLTMEMETVLNTFADVRFKEGTSPNRSKHTKGRRFATMPTYFEYDTAPLVKKHR